MSRYAYSLHHHAKLVHVGYPITACYIVFPGPHRTSNDLPPDRRLCRRCVRNAGLAPAKPIKVRPPRLVVPRRLVTDDLPDLLRDGHSDAVIARQLGVSIRTVGRRIADAMREADARTRFQWGYRVGVAAGGGAS